VEVVREEFIHDSIKKGSIQNTDKYLLGRKGMKRSRNQEEEEEEEVGSEEEEKPSKQANESSAKKPKKETSKSLKDSGSKSLKESAEKVKMTAEEFLSTAKPIKIALDGTDFEAVPKKFGSGAYGWMLAGKTMKMKVGNEEFTTQITFNMPVRGSKPSTK